MEDFKKKNSVLLADIMGHVYALEKRKNICKRKCMIKAIKSKNIKAKEDQLVKLKESNDTTQIQKIKEEIDRDLVEIGAINEYLNNNTPAMIKANEAAVENLAKNTLHTTTASLIQKYLDEYKTALSKDQDSKDAKEIEEIKKKEEEELDLMLIEAEMNATKKTRERARNPIEQTKDLELEELILQNIRKLNDYEPLTQRSILKEILPHTSSSSDSDSSQARICDLYPRKTMVSEITKTDSFEFGPMKKEIEYNLR